MLGHLAGSLELSLMAESLQLNMRCAAGLRHKVASHLDRLMQRILVSAMSMLSRRYRAGSKGSDDEADAETQGDNPTCAHLCHGRVSTTPMSAVCMLRSS